MDDIYTKKPVVTPSDEHILLNSLGGRRTSRTLIDKSTNDRFGKTIDASLGNSVLPIRILLAAHSGDGQPPPTLRNLSGQDGKTYNLRSGGRPEPGRARVDFAEKDGEVSITGHARSEAEARRLLTRKLKSYGKSFEDVAGMLHRARSHVPPLRMRLNFEPGFWRCIAKMACNLFADENREAFLSDSFDPIRRFVGQDQGDAWDFVTVNQEPLRLGSALGELDHLVLVQGDVASGDVVALVAVFEHLQFVVRLGRVDLRSSVASAYRLNQVASAQRSNDEEDLGLQVPPFLRLDAENQEGCISATESAANNIFRVAVARSEDIAREDLVLKCIEEVLGKPDGRPITREEIDKLSALVAERYADMLQHLGAFDRDEPLQ